MGSFRPEAPNHRPGGCLVGLAVRQPGGSAPQPVDHQGDGVLGFFQIQ